MKSILICILSLALGAAAFLTRPTEADFKDYIKKKQPPKDDRSLAKKMLGAPTPTETVLKNYSFEDRLLYVQVDQDGKTLYTGAFDRWYDHQRTTVSDRQPGSR